MSFDVWLAYFFTELVLILIPGPAVVFVTTQGFRYGAAKSYTGALGIACGNLLYFILSALGLGAIILTVEHLFFFIKVVGCAYLIGTGLLMLYSSLKQELPLHNNSISGGSRSFWQGFIIQASNPKAIIFFLALLPQFVDTKGNITMQFTILSLTTIVPETLILMLYGWLSARGSKSVGRNPALAKWKKRIAGLALLGIGINLLFVKSEY